jgi:hypothetical protein
MNRCSAVLSATLLLAWPSLASADSPAALAEKIQKALRAGDMDALVAAVPGFASAPAAQQFTLLDTVNDCTGSTVCTVSAVPLDPAWIEQQRQVLTDAGMELSAKPEGLVEILGRDAQDPTKVSSRVRLPYAKVGGTHAIVAARHTPARLAELKAATPASAAQATLAAGVFDSATGETDPAWVKKAKVLPAGGGEPGAAFLASVKAVAVAVQARDVDAAAKARGDWGKRVLGATDFAGRTRPLPERQRRLRAQAVRFVLEARVLGGYELGDLAVLTIEGTNGAGARVLGALKMRREDGVWQEVDSNDLIEVPKGN